jgi:hypothetical protein
VKPESIYGKMRDHWDQCESREKAAGETFRLFLAMPGEGRKTAAVRSSITNHVRKPIKTKLRSFWLQG